MTSVFATWLKKHKLDTIRQIDRGEVGRLRVGISHLDEAALTDGAERLIAALTAPEARR